MKWTWDPSHLRQGARGGGGSISLEGRSLRPSPSPASVPGPAEPLPGSRLGPWGDKERLAGMLLSGPSGRLTERLDGDTCALAGKRPAPSCLSEYAFGHHPELPRTLQGAVVAQCPSLMARAGAAPITPSSERPFPRRLCTYAPMCCQHVPWRKPHRAERQRLWQQSDTLRGRLPLQGTSLTCGIHMEGLCSPGGKLLGLHLFPSWKETHHCGALPK